MSTYRVCFCGRRKFKLTASEAPQEIKSLFDKYSENGVMSAEQLHLFLVEEQKEKDSSLEDAQGIVDSIKELKHLNLFHHHHKGGGGGLKLEGFFKFLFGDQNPPLSPTAGVHHDMTAPLSHYYIYTGHNSYLTGNQLNSDCSDVPIIDALKAGVRVIELDIWPNSTNDDVDVLHGGTLTSPVALSKCLASIKEHAFVASEYPVVITLEDHLTPELQAKVAQMITDTFGDILYMPEDECFKRLPSPESLKRRVMISTKPPKEYLAAKLDKDSKPREEKEVEGDEEAWGHEVPTGKHDEEDDEDDDNEEDDDEDEDDDDDDPKSQSTGKRHPEYKRLIAIRAGKPKGGMADALRVEVEKVRRLSLSEPQLEKASVDHAQDIVRFTQQNILRIYPKGTRIMSSNYNPLVGWMLGAQMVAFNMQGHGRPLWLMQGMFRGNGGCGFLKKPDFLLKNGPNGEVFDAGATLPSKKTLRVTIYIGEGWYYDFEQNYFDAYSPPDFYTRVGIAGVPADTAMKKTNSVEDNWVPAWNEAFEFGLTVPELAILRIEVHEYDMSEKDDFAGQTCLPVAEIREGVRSVPLHDRNGEKLQNAKLLVRFEFL